MIVTKDILGVRTQTRDQQVQAPILGGSQIGQDFRLWEFRSIYLSIFMGS
jgi:hypothetical protein